MRIPRHTKILISALFAGLGVLSFASPALAADSYEVVKGDTLSEIGAEVGIPWREIAEENNLKSPYIIYPDQVLKLPGDDTGNAVTATVSGPGARQALKLRETTLDSVDISIAKEKYGLDKNTTRHARKAAALLGPMFKLEHIGGWADGGHATNSDHYWGGALDLGIGTIENGHKTGDRIALYALKNRKALDIKYIIWDRHIWLPGEGWRDYHGASDHTDHVHLSFNHEEDPRDH